MTSDQRNRIRNSANSNRRKHNSFTQDYLRISALPFSFFVLASFVMFAIGGKLADPVLEETQVFALMLLPGISSLGIAIAAVVNLSKKRIRAGLINSAAFIASLLGLPIVFFGLCLIGMSY